MSVDSEKKKELEKYRTFGGYKYRIGKHEITIPDFIIKEYEERAKHFSTFNIKDILENYTELSYTEEMSSDMFVWLTNVYKQLAREDYKGLETDYNESKLYFDLAGGEEVHRWPPKLSFTNCDIGGVYLSDFIFTKKKNFELCEFDISDIYRDFIRGVFVYKHNPDEQDDVVSQEQLSKALAAESRTAFHLIYSALDEKYVVRRGNIYEPRGKKLYVNEIRMHGGDEETPDTPTSRDFIRPPMLIGA